jgi:hypothetical protein
MTPITEMTLEQCLWARQAEEKTLDSMIKVNSPFLIKAILEQERKLESLDFWIERKRLKEAAE